MREVAESGYAAIAAVERRIRRLEAQVEALTEAVEALAQGLAGSPMAEPGVTNPAEAARRAHELLLLAKRERDGGQA